MKSWKAVFVSVIGFMLLALSTSLVSCNDPCSDIVCKNNGICRDGKCVCAEGFDGPLCQFRAYEKFIGIWDGTYRCNGGLPLTRSFVIQAGDLPNEVKIYNLFDQGITIIGTVEGIDLEIAEQSINGTTYSGNGYVNANYIVMYLTEDEDGPNKFSCDFNGERLEED